jgi:hypothetical protein
MSSRQTRQQREEEEEEEAARLGGPVSRADFEVLETAAFENAAAAAAAIAAGEQAQEAAAAARESAEEQAAALQAQIAGLSGQIAALVTAASSGGGVVAASVAAAPEPQSAAELRAAAEAARVAAGAEGGGGAAPSRGVPSRKEVIEARLAEIFEEAERLEAEAAAEDGLPPRQPILVTAAELEQLSAWGAADEAGAGGAQPVKYLRTPFVRPSHVYQRQLEVPGEPVPFCVPDLDSEEAVKDVAPYILGLPFGRGQQIEQ